MNRRLEIYKKRVDGVSEINGQLRCDLKKTIQTNLLLEQRLACPYAVDDEGAVAFPGKKDLDKRLDGMFREAARLKEHLKTFDDDELQIRKLKRVLDSPLPKCFGNCHGNVNEK